MLGADLRQSLGRRARASVIERFSLDKALAQLVSLFQELGVKQLV